MRTTRSRAALAAALAVTALAGLAGCAGDSAATTPAAASTALPLVTPGTLTVATDATYAPMESMQGSEFVGADIDLVKDLAQRMGLEVVFVQTGFDDLIDTVSAHRADLIASSMTDRAARRRRSTSSTTSSPAARPSRPAATPSASTVPAPGAATAPP